MDIEVVLVRTYLGKPAQMVVVAHAPGIIYASRPDALERVKSGDCGAIGFPEEDVFRYDAAAHRQLQTLWDASGLLERRMWREMGLARYSIQ